MSELDTKKIIVRLDRSRLLGFDQLDGQPIDSAARLSKVGDKNPDPFVRQDDSGDSPRAR